MQTRMEARRVNREDCEHDGKDLTMKERQRETKY